MTLHPADHRLLIAVRGAAVVAGGIVVLVLALLVIESAPAWRTLGFTRWWTDSSWHPADHAASGRFNLVPMVVGTLAATLGAVLLATPIGLASALFSAFYAPPALAKLYRRLIELLAGIPSVVFGFWGLTTLAPWIGRWRPPGQSLLTAVLILAIMIVPTIALLSDAAMRAAPRPGLQAAAALGLSRWATIRAAILPAARGGLVAALFLAAIRALGETMAVLMVAGNVVQVPSSVFDPIRTLTANIALELGYAVDLHRSALFVTALILMVLVIVPVLAVDRFGDQSRHE